jgi:hypothetical protein
MAKNKAGELEMLKNNHSKLMSKLFEQLEYINLNSDDMEITCKIGLSDGVLHYYFKTSDFDYFSDIPVYPENLTSQSVDTLQKLKSFLDFHYSNIFQKVLMEKQKELLQKKAIEKLNKYFTQEEIDLILEKIE